MSQTQKGCTCCAHYSALVEPRPIDGMDDAFIYGYCFKAGTKPYNLGMGKGFPVYIPEAVCKDFKRRKNNEREHS